jgi:hypothetical protein
MRRPLLAVRGIATFQAVALQGLDHPGPAEALDERLKSGRPGFFWTVQDGIQRLGDGFHVKWGYHFPQVIFDHPFAGHVTSGDQHRQAGPEVIEHAGADGVARFNVDGVKRDPQAGFVQQGLPILVGNPFEEDDGTAFLTDLLRQSLGFPGHLVLRHQGIGVAGAQEHQSRLRVAVDHLRPGLY